MSHEHPDIFARLNAEELVLFGGRFGTDQLPDADRRRAQLAVRDVESDRCGPALSELREKRPSPREVKPPEVRRMKAFNVTLQLAGEELRELERISAARARAQESNRDIVRMRLFDKLFRAARQARPVRGGGAQR